MASFLDQIFGAKPQVAPFLPTDPLAELHTLLGGEISDWSQIEQLGNLYQTYMMGALNEAVPGFSDILKQGGADTEALLKEAQPLIEGQIPADVASQVMRSAAFQSLGAGTAGSPMGGALTARDLGLTSLDMMSQGANLLGAGGNAAQRWAQIASGTILPPSANLYSPEWFSTFMAQQRAGEQATQQMKFNVAASPNPALQALNQWIEQVGGTAIGAYTGGGMGGGMGKGGGGGSYMTSFNPGQMEGNWSGNVQQGGAAPGVQAGFQPGTIADTGGYGAYGNAFSGGGGYSTVPMPYGIGANPFNAGYNLSLAPTDPTQAGYFGFGGG